MTVEPMDNPVEHIAVWRRTTRTHWLDHCHIRGTRLGWSLEGTIIAAGDGGSFRAQYRINLDRLWRTRMAGISIWQGVEQHGFRMGRDDEDHWTIFTGSADLSVLDGSLDVVMALTPATLTLPIRRLGLGVGDSADLTAAHIRADLSIEPLEVHVTRSSDATYRFEYGQDDREPIEVTVDDFGLALHTSQGWERVE